MTDDVTPFDVVIVGAGHGGAQAAMALRQRGFTGTIALVGDEPDFPYERPPLSKEYLAREKAFERILIRPPHFWTEKDIELRLGSAVSAIDPLARTVVTGDDASLGYQQLIWAAGGRPRGLSCDGHDLTGIHTVRTRADVDRLFDELPLSEDVVVIGGGYIGLEAAAALTKTGHRITIVEAQDRVLARVAGVPLSRFYEAEHRAHGNDLRLSAAVSCVEGRDGAVTGVRLADGEVLPAGIVIVGIGIVPSVEPLIVAGAAGDNGITVDEHCRTSLPNIYAIGDCAAHANRFADGRTIRLESVQNANDMAATVARAITGDAQPYNGVPWFWSNQYDLKLQTVGLSIGHDAAILRGDPDTRSFSIVYLRKGRVIALDCVNAVRDYVQGKSLVLAGAVISPERLADAGRPLKEMLV